MKIITVVLIGLLILSLVVSVNFVYQDYNESKEEDERLQELFERKDNSPGFMKNGEWFDIILNGYNRGK